MEQGEVKSKFLREKIIYKKLLHGVRAYFIPKKAFQKKVGILATGFGSVDLDFEMGGKRSSFPAGIAHMLEHLLFKKEEGDLLPLFGRLGAYCNAHVDYSETSYYFSCVENYEEALKLLLKIVFSAHFSRKLLEKEKSIVHHEIRSSVEDRPIYMAERDLISALYRVHPIRFNALGTHESVEKITVEDLANAYNIFYQPSSLVFVGSGDLEPQKVFDLLEEEIERYPPCREIHAKRIYPIEPEDVGERYLRREGFLSSPWVFVGFKESMDQEMDLLLRGLASEMVLELIFGKSTRFFNRNYEAGLINDTFGYSYRFDKDFAFTIVSGETHDPGGLVERLRYAIRKAFTEGFKKREIYILRRKTLGRFLSSFDAPESLSHLVVWSSLKGVDLFAIPKMLKRLDKKLLMERLARQLEEKRLSISVVEPFGE
jgi:predicted Zn-dependent peptidase